MKISLLFLALAFTGSLSAQNFTRDDTLRGSVTPERAWWDLNFYDLRLSVDPATRSIQGSNMIRYRVLEGGNNLLQVDLQPPLIIEKVEQNGLSLAWEKAGKNAYLVQLRAPQKAGDTNALTIYYSGKPRVARQAPWDGGFSWAKDKSGKPFVATSCQGLGASVWWPCKDHMYDEPDSMAISVTVPPGLTDVSNGRLRKVTNNADGTTTFDWFVVNPINNYGVNVNIADYVHFSDTFAGEKGALSLDFYVLPDALEAAREQFKQAKLMLTAFEHWFGPYPFYEDGYKLVQVPYLGMEHQSSVTYGNGFTNGYLRSDLSRSGWGLKWDYIIIHESGHEWFANNITYRDIADMWIHESFTSYSECLYTEFYFGKAAGAEYVIGLRGNIKNNAPIIGHYDVNDEGSGDMYPKGANMLHTIRQLVNDDEKWRQILRGLNRDFYHQIVDSRQIEQYIAQKSGLVLDKVFDQYLRSAQIPRLEYELKNKTLRYRWANCVPGFDMPLNVTLERNKFTLIRPTTEWQTIACKVKADQFRVDENFYVESGKL